MIKKKCNGIEHNIFMQIFLFFLGMSVVGVFYFLSSNLIISYKINHMKIVEDKTIFKQIESFTLDDSTIELSGWILKSGMFNNEIWVLLRDVETSKSKKIKATMTKREDVCSYYVEDYNKNFGFLVCTSLEKISLDKCYEILIYLEYESEESDVRVAKKISTKTFLYQGELYEYNPKTFVAPKFVDPFMEEVISNGKLCVYDIENEFWVYSYGNYLYWIAGKKVPFNKQDKKSIYYHVNSVEASHLKEENINCMCGNQDFWFEDYELEFAFSEQYRVASRQMTECRVKYISTGVYDMQNKSNLLSYGFQFKNEGR